ncbi:hypothetical protein ACIRQP_19335 [Streptomyces sp. NPDC102274]|uniref:hypothetical protein n=1 Tax=Streptomyces sp. NPDC102274 TaxID=3366151 RepID=UPI00381D35CF
MSRRGREAATPPGAARPTVTVCRGCCCGTPRAPHLDHAAQLADLRTSLADVASLGRVFKVPPARRRPARTLAALSGSPQYVHWT